MKIEDLIHLSHPHLLVLSFDESKGLYECAWFDDGEVLTSTFSAYELLHEIQVCGCKVYGDFF